MQYMNGMNISRAVLSQIPVRRSLGVFDALQVLALYQALDTFLDHIDFWAEASGELSDHFTMKLLMRKFLALSGVVKRLANVGWKIYARTDMY